MARPTAFVAVIAAVAVAVTASGFSQSGNGWEWTADHDVNGVSHRITVAGNHHVLLETEEGRLLDDSFGIPALNIISSVADNFEGDSTYSLNVYNPSLVGEELVLSRFSPDDNLTIVLDASSSVTLRGCPTRTEVVAVSGSRISLFYAPCDVSVRHDLGPDPSQAGLGPSLVAFIGSQRRTFEINWSAAADGSLRYAPTMPMPSSPSSSDDTFVTKTLCALSDLTIIGDGLITVHERPVQEQTMVAIVTTKASLSTRLSVVSNGQHGSSGSQPWMQLSHITPNSETSMQLELAALNINDVVTFSRGVSIDISGKVILCHLSVAAVIIPFMPEVIQPNQAPLVPNGLVWGCPLAGGQCRLVHRAPAGNVVVIEEEDAGNVASNGWDRGEDGDARASNVSTTPWTIFATTSTTTTSTSTTTTTTTSTSISTSTLETTSYTAPRPLCTWDELPWQAEGMCGPRMSKNVCKSVCKACGLQHKWKKKLRFRDPDTGERKVCKRSCDCTCIDNQRACGRYCERAFDTTSFRFDLNGGQGGGCEHACWCNIVEE